MKTSLVIPTLMGILILTCGVAQGRQRPYGGKGLSRARAEAFLKSSPLAQRQLASVRAKSSVRPAFAIPPCPCAQATCQEQINTQFICFHNNNPCIILYPFNGLQSRDCSPNTNGITCTEIPGCGCPNGICNNWSPTPVLVFAVCFPFYPPYPYPVIKSLPVNNGCCCV